MISINVFSEEKAWSKRLKNKDIFFKKICKAFPKKYKFLNKKVTFTLLLSNNKNITEGLIEISLKDLGEEVSIQIKDNGIGFPSNDTDKLLEPYYTTREMGTGIGLSVVKNIIEVHKGIIKLDNKLTENGSVIGAIVTLFIPKTLNNDLEMMNE